MTCPNCNRQLKAGVNFCSYCGTPVSQRVRETRRSRDNQPRKHAHFYNLISGVREFWNQLSEGLTLHVLWDRFRSEARESYSLYIREVDWESLRRERPFRRFTKVSRALFWAMVMKLSPARRVLLLVALVLALSDFVISVPVNTGHGIEPFLTANVRAILAFCAFILLLALELADRVVMKRDLEIAREIQGWLVPKAPPEIEGVDIAFATRPANTVAGDYYDAFLRPGIGGATAIATAVPQQKLLVVVADVAGKSVPAALLMATFQASLRTLAATPVSLEELAARLNDYACHHSLGGLRFTTAFIAEIEPKTLSLSYINAGHNPPVLRRASGEVVRLKEGGLPLGIQADVRYAVGSIELVRGDLLVVLTDGVVEAENEEGEEYGETRLLELLKINTGGSASEELKRLMSSVDLFVGSARQHDDITCLFLRIK
jgi:sigma-B regulation protein RsbU (phosphoserine phosphatase)